MVIVDVKFTVVPAQMLAPCDEEIEIVGAAVEFTVITMLLLIAVDGFGQARLLLISQVTTSPLLSELVTYVAEFAPMVNPFTFHTNVGVPPFTGVAVKVTEVPAQIVEPALLAIETLVATLGFTVMVMLLLVAEPLVTHVSEVVISQVTTSPLLSELLT